ncbi:MAG TPA: hypothetical protein VL147_05030 [Devosia sp.]|nr:hypothetical protein [Devosia sp.]
MAREFRVVDCRANDVDPVDTIISAQTPEEAARLALGEYLERSGQKRDLRARVYFQTEGQPLTMVRLYSKAIDREEAMRLD